jgi:pantetheine-phosphate adenylyltransferase
MALSKPLWSRENASMSQSRSTALYPGSFDPPHLGHLNIIERAAASFDKLLVAVVGNPAKSSGLLAVEDRINLLRQVTSQLANVEVVRHEGLLVELANARGADMIVRGVGKEALGELEMAGMNRRLGGIQTMFLQPAPATAFISSRTIRTLVWGGEVSRTTGLVPSAVATALLDYSRAASPPS